jgi:hypothetical protein
MHLLCGVPRFVICGGLQLNLNGLVELVSNPAVLLSNLDPCNIVPDMDYYIINAFAMWSSKVCYA